MTAILKVKDGNGNVIPIQAIKGEKGEKGDRGLPGSGGVPDGGTTGQVLTKNSNADGDAGWKDISGYLSEKLDKNQGTANSGKFLGIGADGIVVPTEVNKQWKLMFEHVVTDEDVTNKVAQFQYFDDSIDAEDVMIIIDWKTQSNSNLIISASNKGSNWNYIANMVNGFGVRNNQKDVWHIHCEKISDDLRILEYSRRLGATGNENSDFNSGRLSGSESKRVANASVNGVRIAPYGWAKIGETSVEYGLLAGTDIKVFWR